MVNVYAFSSPATAVAFLGRRSSGGVSKAHQARRVLHLPSVKNVKVYRKVTRANVSGRGGANRVTTITTTTITTLTERVRITQRIKPAGAQVKRRNANVRSRVRK